MPWKVSLSLRLSKASAEQHWSSPRNPPHGVQIVTGFSEEGPRAGCVTPAPCVMSWQPPCQGATLIPALPLSKGWARRIRTWGDQKRRVKACGGSHTSGCPGGGQEGLQRLIDAVLHDDKVPTATLLRTFSQGFCLSPTSYLQCRTTDPTPSCKDRQASTQNLGPPGLRWVPREQLEQCWEVPLPLATKVLPVGRPRAKKDRGQQQAVGSQPTREAFGAAPPST